WTTDSIAHAADSISASEAEQIEESKAPADASHESRKRKQIKGEEMKEEDKEMVYWVQFGIWLQWQVVVCGFIIFAPGVNNKL
ncbi:hypothetical protein LINPERPRIM_LOCUS16713, partial [Linum perenne]